MTDMDKLFSLNKDSIEAIKNASKAIQELQETVLDYIATNGGLAGINYVDPNTVKWFTCPDCGQKLCRIDDSSVAHKIYLWCKHCKKEVEMNI